MDPEKKEFGKWWVWVLCLLVLTFGTFGVLNAAGIIGKTVVEREVFERSFQFDQARQTEIATYRAQIAELESQLLNPTLDDGTKANLNAQLSALRVRLSTAEQRSN